MRGRLTIPRGQEEQLASILRMSDAEMSAFLDALSGAGHAYSIRKLSQAVAGKLDVGESETLSTIRVLSTLISMMDRLDVVLDDFVKEIEKSSLDTSNDALTNPEIGWDLGKRRFRDLLSCKSLIVTAKAQALFSESEKSFCDARIVSDVRPIFVGSADDAPEAFVMIHTLRVSFHTKGSIESVDIVLDSADVKLLENSARRAASKESSIIELVERTGTSVMRAVTHEG